MRPNIIFRMDDQHRWDAMGHVNPQVRTPTLDRLAAAAMETMTGKLMGKLAAQARRP